MKKLKEPKAFKFPRMYLTQHLSYPTGPGRLRIVYPDGNVEYLVTDLNPALECDMEPAWFTSCFCGKTYALYLSIKVPTNGKEGLEAMRYYDRLRGATKANGFHCYYLGEIR